MYHLSKVPLVFAILILVQACDQVPKSPATKNSSDQNLLAKDVDQLESGVRLAAANKRIDELERKVDELEATPEKLDLDLLSQRVTALEVKANDTISIVPQTPLAKEKPATPQSTERAARSDANARQTPASASTFKLPDLENRARPATPAEAKAFPPRK